MGKRRDSSALWHCSPGFGMMLLPRFAPEGHSAGGEATTHERESMRFDPDRFLMHYADAFNGRDPERLRTFFALEDDRFAVFEDYSEELFDGETYGVVLEGAFDATGEMSFDLLRCDRFDDFAIIHAVQKIVDEEEEGDRTPVETRSRATMWVALSGEDARVVAAHFSAMPSSAGQAPPAGTG